MKIDLTTILIVAGVYAYWRYSQGKPIIPPFTQEKQQSVSGINSIPRMRIQNPDPGAQPQLPATRRFGHGDPLTDRAIKYTI